MMADYYCNECGEPVGQYLSLFGMGWMHVTGTDGASCANARGDREWFPVEQPEIGGAA